MVRPEESESREELSRMAPGLLPAVKVFDDLCGFSRDLLERSFVSAARAGRAGAENRAAVEELTERAELPGRLSGRIP
jgi:hypothetical protein